MIPPTLLDRIFYWIYIAPYTMTVPLIIDCIIPDTATFYFQNNDAPIRMDDDKICFSFTHAPGF